MNDLIQTISERKFEIVKATIQHIQISLVALFVAILIAIPLAVLIQNRKKLENIVLQVTGIFQIIPSLALLGLFIPILGIGKTPAIVVLIIYGIFPILQSTLVGLQSIDPLLEEAGEAFGMTRFEKLRKYQIPLSLSAIIGGIRTSIVLLIGTATLAALVGAGGLGTFILLGIDRNNTSLILIGAIFSALLAILFNFALKYLETKKIKQIVIAFFLVFLLLISSLFFGLNNSNRKLIIAGKMGAEPEILINMYKELIESKSNIKVELKPSFGKTSFLYEALKNNSIDIYPEFTGTITSSLLKDPPVGITNNSEAVYEAAKAGILRQYDLVLLKPMEYQNTFAIAVKKEYAKENNLTNISDLKRIENNTKAGFTLEFNDREDGNKGLQSIYGLNLNVVTMEPSLRYKALNNGEINVIEVYSTDSEIVSQDLVLINDDKELFPPYQGAPLLRADTLEQYPELENILSLLSGKITTKEMQEMNYAVDVKGQSANAVAKKYLQSNNLI